MTQFTIRPWHIVVASVAALAVVGGTVYAATTVVDSRLASSATTTAPAVNTSGFPTGPDSTGIFTDTCMLTITKPNDPIMMPGMTGSSMQHDFFGNPAVTASSTPAALVGGQSSCTTSADSSAYWTPVVYQNGTALTPKATLLYWRAPAATATAVKSMPAGITMIAGNEAASAPQSTKIVNWTCTQPKGSTAPVKASNTPHDCGSQDLRLIITFPNCWDGHTLDGMKQTNVVYATSKNGACPASHPVQIPQIVMHVAYPTSTADNLTLSIGPTLQGPTITGHADFMNGWTQSRMDADVAACIDTQTRCGSTSGPLATPKGGKQK